MLRILCACLVALFIPIAAIAETGIASWYESGHTTANGEKYIPNGISCAHKSLAFNSRVRVTNQNTGQSIICRINDRGPFIRGRIIDLSRGAARQLGMIGSGTAQVTVEVIQ